MCRSSASALGMEISRLGIVRYDLTFSCVVVGGGDDGGVVAVVYLRCVLFFFLLTLTSKSEYSSIEFAKHVQAIIQAGLLFFSQGLGMSVCLHTSV